MKSIKDKCRIAVVQYSPVMFDKDANVARMADFIAQCAANGAELVVFPELCIPGYPLGMTFGFTVGSRNKPGRVDWKTYYDNSILADGEEMQILIDAAKKAGVYVSLGYSEKDPISSTLYNSNMMISPEGETVNHRKIKPTGSERVVWGDADKQFFPVMETPWGPMGCMICWESYMPLARVALYQKGITLYISCNTNDNPEWQNTIRHIAIEGHCFFVNADLFFTRSMYPATAGSDEEIAKLNELACRGGSCVIDPFGHDASETVWDKEAVIYADLDMQTVISSKMEHDVIGHYARPDILHLEVEDR